MASDEQLVKLIEHYQKALLIKPRNSAVYQQLAELYYQQGDLEKAIEICQHTLRIQPDSVPASQALREILIRLGFSKEEIQCLWKSFLDALPEEVFMTLEKAVKPLGELQEEHTVETWKEAISLGNTFVKQQLWREAFHSYLRAIELEASLKFSHLAIQYFVLPRIDDLEAIANLYLQAIQLPKSHCLSYTVLGDILTRQNKLPEAICAYKNAWSKSSQQTSIEEQSDQKRTSIDYLVIGVGKAGTTSLAYYLSQHPQIINPHKKELHFFTRDLEYGLDWYLAQFPPILSRKDKFLTGEATPWYLGGIGVEDRVFRSFPHVKLIAILRNPIDRTISHYYMHWKMGLEHRSLEEAIADEIAILRDTENPLQVSEAYWRTEHGYLWSSLYLPFLERWMSLFHKDQFLVLNSKDLYTTPSETLAKVFKFLNVTDFELVSYPKVNSGTYSQASHHSRKILFDFFHVHNQKLEDYLGMKFGWNDTL